jgi:hypothetical protein
MLYIQPDLFKRQLDLDREEAMRRAEQWRWVQEARAGVRPWVYRFGCRLLCGLGQAMVVLGQRLQRYGQPQRAAAEG